MKVYVVMDDRFPDPEAVFSKKKHAIKYANHVVGHESHFSVYRFKVQDKSKVDYESVLGERIVTNPSSY